MSDNKQSWLKSTKISKGNTTILILATLAYSISFATSCLYSPLGPHLREDFHLNEMQLGVLLSAPALLGSILRIPVGILAEAYGEREVFSLILALCFVFTVLTMYAGSYFSLLVCGLLMGIGRTTFVAGVPLISRCYPPERQGFALGILGVGTLGAALSTLFTERIVHHFLNGHWRYVFPFYAVPLLAVLFFYWNYVSDAPHPHKTKTLRKILEVYRRTPLVWAFCLFYWVSFGFFVCFAMYLPAYLVKTYGLSRMVAGDFATAFIVIGSLIRVFGGYMADRLSGRKILIVINIISAICLLLEGLAHSPVVAAPTFILLGACLGIGNGVVFKLLPTYFARETGAVGGLVGAAGGLGGFFTPIILGISKDITDSYFYGFAVAASICLLCVFLARNEFQRANY